MKKYILTTFASVMFFSAVSLAGEDNVPKIEDFHNIVVDGQKMTQQAFLEKYCIGKINNETCLKVEHAMRLDSTKGEIPRF